VDDNPSQVRPLRLLRAVRIAVVVQALALLALIAFTIPDFVDYRLHPLICSPGQLCLDLRGIRFEVEVLYFGLPALLLLTTCWLWRRPRRWPAAVLIPIDVAAIAFEVGYPLAFSRYFVVQALLLLLPAVIALILVLALLRQWDWRRAAPV
jgi:hypothetical protein